MPSIGILKDDHFKNVNPPDSIPEKLYFKIGEVAEIVGVKPYVLRYWEKEFPDIAPSKTQGQQRLYHRDEVERICKIRDLLYQEKFTISGARKRLKMKPSNGAPELQIGLPLPAEQPLQQRLQELHRQLLELAQWLK